MHVRDGFYHSQHISYKLNGMYDYKVLYSPIQGNTTTI